jgi:hypothetical protein
MHIVCAANRGANAEVRNAVHALASWFSGVRAVLLLLPERADRAGDCIITVQDL